jgi:hypothetical protein
MFQNGNSKRQTLALNTAESAKTFQDDAVRLWDGIDDLHTLSGDSETQPAPREVAKSGAFCKMKTVCLLAACNEAS